MTEARQEALQRQLENDEPKCGNCAYWHRDGNRAYVAETQEYREFSPAIGRCMLGNLMNTVEHVAERFTTDLSVCSKWAPK